MSRRFAILAIVLLAGCASRQKLYGTELVETLPASAPSRWAVAPALNISGQRAVDPILQADLVYQEIQHFRGITAVPVNRVIEVYASLNIMQVQSQEQAAIVCDLLGVDALLVPTVTLYDPYDPPKLGAALQLFTRNGAAQPANFDPVELTRQATPGPLESLPKDVDLLQAASVYDASNGSTRQKLELFASGRADPQGPLGTREFLVNMDRYSAFVWSDLTRTLIEELRTAQK